VWRFLFIWGRCKNKEKKTKCGDFYLFGGDVKKKKSLFYKGDTHGYFSSFATGA
jgi:hypothetical protein